MAACCISSAEHTERCGPTLVLSDLMKIRVFMLSRHIQMHTVPATWMVLCKHAGPHESCIQSTHVRVHINVATEHLSRGILGRMPTRQLQMTSVLLSGPADEMMTNNVSSPAHGRWFVQGTTWQQCRAVCCRVSDVHAAHTGGTQLMSDMYASRGWRLQPTAAATHALC